MSRTQGGLFGLDTEVIGERDEEFWPTCLGFQKTMDFASGKA
jgi:hypothetical protein